MRKLIVYFLPALFLFSCQKENLSSSDGKYFFKYTVNGKNGGYSGNMDLLTTNEAYTAMASSMGILSAFRSTDCNVNGKPPCFSAMISLEKLALGKHDLSKPGCLFIIAENDLSFSPSKYWISAADGVGEGVITLTEVGEVGGTVAGTFSGKAELEGTDKTFTVSGSFRLKRTH